MYIDYYSVSSHNLAYIDQSTYLSNIAMLYSACNGWDRTKAAVQNYGLPLWSKQGIHHMTDEQQHTSCVFTNQEQERVIRDEIRGHPE